VLAAPENRKKGREDSHGEHGKQDKMEPQGYCQDTRGAGWGEFLQGSWESGERDKGKHGIIKWFTIIFLALVIILCLGAIAIEAQTMICRTIDDVVYDNRNHYLPCEQLPAELEVRKVIEEHQDVSVEYLLERKSQTDDAVYSRFRKSIGMRN
jgi:hypothetical protein